MKTSANRVRDDNSSDDSGPFSTQQSAEEGVCTPSVAALPCGSRLWREAAAAGGRHGGPTVEVYKMVPCCPLKVERGHGPPVSPFIPCSNGLRSEFLLGGSSLVATGHLLCGSITRGRVPFSPHAFDQCEVNVPDHLFWDQDDHGRRPVVSVDLFVGNLRSPTQVFAAPRRGLVLLWSLAVDHQHLDPNLEMVTRLTVEPPIEVQRKDVISLRLSADLLHQIRLSGASNRQGAADGVGLSCKKESGACSEHLFSPVAAKTLPPGGFNECVPAVHQVAEEVEEAPHQLKAGVYASLLKERALLPNDCWRILGIMMEGCSWRFSHGRLLHDTVPPTALAGDYRSEDSPIRGGVFAVTKVYEPTRLVDAGSSSQVGMWKVREMRTLAAVLDAMRAGALPRAADLLVQRLKACETAITTGDADAAVQLELIPRQDVGLTSIEERRVARRASIIDRKLKSG